MSAESQDRMVEMQRLMEAMGSALAASEARTRRLERGLRWAGIGALAALALALGPTLRPLGTAIAQGAAPSPSKSVEEALDRINQNLMPLGMMGQIMQAGMTSALFEAQAAVKDEKSNSPLRPYLVAWLKDHKVAPEAATMQHFQQALMEAMGGVFIDAAVLVARVRKDSDVIHGTVVKVLEALSNPSILPAIGHELATLNKALASVPRMSDDMSLMTQQMGSMSVNMGIMTQQMGAMSYSVGSTMGKAGSWMPW